MSKPDGCKSASDVDFRNRLFEVVIDLEQKCGGWLLLLKHPETSTMFFSRCQITPYQVFGRCEWCGVIGKCDDSDLLTCENRDNNVAYVR
jgi:hypothetical protein